MAKDLSQFLTKEPQPPKDLSQFITEPQGDTGIRKVIGDNKGTQVAIQESGFFDNPTGAPSLLETAKNIPSSAFQFGKDIFSAVRHPKETLKGLGTVVAGGVEKLIPGEQEHEQSFDALTGFFKQRYGSLENIKQTIETDPVGFLSDVASVIALGGTAIKGLGSVSRAKKLQSVGTSIQKAGTALEPISIASKGLGGAKSKALAPFAGSVDTGVQDIARIKGVDLPVGARSTNKFLGLQEVFASKGLFGGKIGKAIDTAFNKIRSIGDDIVAKTGGKADNVRAGKAIVGGIENQKQTFIRMKNDLYDKVIPLTGKGAPIVVDASETVKILKVFAEELRRGKNITGLGGDLALWEKLIAELSPKGGANKLKGLQAIDVRAALQRLDSLMKKEAGFISTGDNARRMKVVATLSNELDNAIISARPELAKALKEANDFFASSVKQLNSRLAQRIKAVASQPDKVFNIAFTPSTGLDEMKQILNVLTPEDLRNFRATAMQKIMDGATSSKTGKFTTAGLRKEMDKLGGAKMSLIFEPKQIKALEDLDTLSKAMGKVEQISGGSQTAFLQRGLTEVIIGTVVAFQNLPLALTLLGGDLVISKLLTSAGGKKWLLDGLTLPQKVNQALGALPATAKGAFQAGRIERATNQE